MLPQKANGIQHINLGSLGFCRTEILFSVLHFTTLSISPHSEALCFVEHGTFGDVSWSILQVGFGP